MALEHKMTAAKVADSLSPRQRSDLLVDIHEVLDGREWDADTLSLVASFLISAGFVIREPDSAEGR